QGIDAELDAPLLTQADILLDRKIESLDQRTGDAGDGARRVAELAGGRELEGRIVHIGRAELAARATAFPIRVGQRYTGDNVRADFMGVDRVDVIVGGDRGSKGIACGEPLDAGDVPISQDKLKRLPSVGAECPASSVGKVVDRDQIPSVGDVESRDRSIAG